MASLPPRRAAGLPPPSPAVVARLPLVQPQLVASPHRNALPLQPTVFLQHHQTHGEEPSAAGLAQGRLLRRPAEPRSPVPSGVRIGTWNLSHWSAGRAEVLLRDIAVDIMAVQETHLAPLPLEGAHSTARRLGLHLLHGRPCRPLPNSTHGRSCGVGFVMAAGVAVSPVLPQGTCWRHLHSLRRLHALRLPPRPGLPHGLLLFSIYAPLAEHYLEVERAHFAASFIEFTHQLDMQVPTLLLGDFNGSFCPARDFLRSSVRQRPPCPLLSHLLGPGGAWIDTHATLAEPPLEWTFRMEDADGLRAASRIDLILADQAALPLIRSVTVLSSVRDGGHSPVLITLSLDQPLALHWRCPRPQPPSLLLRSSADLRSSPDWQ